jgi:hypothetical protein
MIKSKTGILLATVFMILCICRSSLLFSQSPEISLREFASGQIKKGVRSIGMGGDGATWGNYSLIWRDSSTALVDAGLSEYSNRNTFSFTAVAATTPSLWHRLAVYAIALSQYASNISTALKSPALGTGAVPVHGDGNNQAVFVKAAMPLKNGFSIGVLLSYERSQFHAVADENPAEYVRYNTNWLPSGGFWISWQPNKNILIGFRALLNHDRETRTDSKGAAEGLNLSHEYRLGISSLLWKGALIDVGGNLRYKYNAISNTKLTRIEPNLGFEQNFFGRHFALRAGVDETSPTAGFSLRSGRIVFDAAYIHNLAGARLAGLFGTTSNSVIATLLFSFERN